MNLQPFVVKNPDKFASWVIGLALLADGVIRTTSLGWVSGRFSVTVTNWALRRQFERQKAEPNR